MKSYPIRFSVLSLLLVWASSSLAQGGPICEFPWITGECPADRYAMIYHNTMGQPMGDPTYCNSVQGRYCMKSSAGIPPAPAWIHCASAGHRMVSCSVYPQGDMHYSWSTSGQIAPSNPPNWSGPSQLIHCNEVTSSGLVSVIVTAPNGYSESVFQGVSCGTIEY